MNITLRAKTPSPTIDLGQLRAAAHNAMLIGGDAEPFPLEILGPDGRRIHGLRVEWISGDSIVTLGVALSPGYHDDMAALWLIGLLRMLKDKVAPDRARVYGMPGLSDPQHEPGVYSPSLNRHLPTLTLASLEEKKTVDDQPA